MPINHYLEFSGGLQNRTSRYLGKPNEAQALVNFHNDEIGSLTKRLGMKRAGGQIASNKTIRTVQGGGKYLYAAIDATNTDIYYNNSATDPKSGTWTASTGGTEFPVASYPQYTTIPELGLMFTVGSKKPTAGSLLALTDMGVVRQSSYNSAPQTLANSGSGTALPPKGRWMFKYRDRIYIGYCGRNSGWSTNNWYNESVDVKPNRWIFSNAPVGGAITWEDQGVAGYKNFIDLSYETTGGATNSDQMILWTPETMTVRSGTETTAGIPDLQVKYAIGCESGLTVKNLDIYTFWYWRNGVYAYSGGKPERISNPIQPIINAITDPSACFADAPDDDHYRLYIGTVTVSGMTFTNCVLQYTLSMNSWTIYSYSIPHSGTITSMGSFWNGSRRHLYIGTSQGEIFEHCEAYDTSPSYSDGDQAGQSYPITCLMLTQEMDWNLPSERERIAKIIVYSKYAQGMIVQGRSDGIDESKSWSNIGQLKSVVDEFTPDLPVGYWQQLLFTETSKNPPCALMGFSVDVKQETQFA